jgi:flagellar basal-body rod modification protein FlgD
MIAMNVNALSTSTATTSAAAATAASKSMGKDAFLKLLVTQLQHQDPLNPADSTEFTAQLAQFSSLEQLSNINQSLETLNLYQTSINNAQAVSLIGKEILATGNALEKKNGLPVNCEFELEAAASRVVVSIYDRNGGFVADVLGSSMSAGRGSLVWDGRNRNGSPVADGIYTYNIQAEGVDGKKVAASSQMRGRVSGVTLDGSTPLLMVGERRVAFGDVLQVTAPSATDENG